MYKENKHMYKISGTYVQQKGLDVPSENRRKAYIGNTVFKL